MDDESIVIQLELKNLAAAMAGIKRVSQAVGGMNKGVQQQAQAAKQLKNGYQQALGPAQKLVAAQIALQRAQKSGGPMAIFDAQYRLHQAQKAHANAQKALNPPAPPGLGKKLMSAVMSSRLGMSGGGLQIMPLISKLAEVLGPEATAAVAVATAAVAAGAALIQMAKDAAEAGVAFAKLGLQAGGSGRETGQLSVFGNAAGVDMGSMAREFADAISHNGMAAGFAARAGIHDYGAFDTTNKAGKLLAWLDHLRQLSPQEAMRAARVTGTEGLLPLRGLSDKTMGTLKADAGLKASIMTPEFQKNALEFQVAMGRVSDAFSNLMVAVIKPFLPGLTKMSNDLADWINGMAKWVNEHQNAIKGIGDIFKGLFEILIGMPGGLTDIIKGIKEIGTPGKKAEDAHTTAMDRHARALDDNTYALNNGTYGGGERARGAVPSKWRGMNTEHYIGQAAKLGAFAL